MKKKFKNCNFGYIKVKQGKDIDSDLIVKVVFTDGVKYKKATNNLSIYQVKELRDFLTKVIDERN